MAQERTQTNMPEKKSRSPYAGERLWRYLVLHGRLYRMLAASARIRSTQLSKNIR